MSNVRILTSAEGMRSFINSNIWEDIKNTLEDWDEGVKAEYDECKSLEHLENIKGRREAIAYMLQIPYRIVEGLELEKYNEKQEIQGGSDE